jgi:predicted N-acetyltransferase YhbS
MIVCAQAVVKPTPRRAQRLPRRSLGNRIAGGKRNDTSGVPGRRGGWMPDIRPLTEADLPQARRIFRLAFGTLLGAPDLETFSTDRDYAGGRFGAEHVASFAADEDGVLVGSNFAVRWGSVGYFGPLSIRPDLWNSGIGQRLVRAACDAFDAWGVRHAGLYTFADSAKHVALYGKFGFHPRFLTAIMNAPARSSGGARWSRYSELPATQRREAESAIREVTEQLYQGLDLGAEVRNVHARNLGDTALMWHGDSRLAGFAVCHWGPSSEAGAGSCLVKFGAVRPEPGVEDRFAALIDACGDLALAAGMPNVLAAVNLAHEEAYRHLLTRSFRTQIQGVTMHRPNEPGYSCPGLYVIDDWR